MKPDNMDPVEWLATDPPLDEVLTWQAGFAKRVDAAIKRAEQHMIQQRFNHDPYPDFVPRDDA
jgi:hypothetical protein